MDSHLPLDESRDTTDGVSLRGRPLFHADSNEAEALYISEREYRHSIPGSRRSRRLLVTTGLIGAASICALIYAATEHGGSRLASFTAKVPDAASSGAVITNLPPPNLLKPVSPVEALKENADRPFVDRPDSPAARFVLKGSADDKDRALNCLTQAVYYEAASEGSDGERAVAQVVLNRMRHPGFPASVCGVVYEGSDRTTGCQFTFACDGSLVRPHVDAIWNRSRKIAEEALSGHVFAPVGHATHYHADYVLPYWADSLDKTVQIGRHIFYRLRGAVGDKRAFFQRYAGFEPSLPAPLPIVTGVTANTPEQQQQLAKALVSDNSAGAAKDVEKAAAGRSALAVDAAVSTLIADGQAPRAQPTDRRSRRSSQCNADADQKQLTPLGANDLRSVSISPSC